MHWLAQHMPKSVKYRFTTFSQLSVRERSKNYFGVTLSNLTVSFNKKPKSTIQEKMGEIDFYWFYGFIGWQTMLQNILEINLPNFIK